MSNVIPCVTRYYQPLWQSLVQRVGARLTVLGTHLYYQSSGSLTHWHIKSRERGQPTDRRMTTWQYNTITGRYIGRQHEWVHGWPATKRSKIAIKCHAESEITETTVTRTQWLPSGTDWQCATSDSSWTSGLRGSSILTLPTVRPPNV